MAEEALNLSLDEIIARNAENKKTSLAGGRRGGRGGSRGSRNSSQAPRVLGVQTRVITKPVRGRGQGRGASRGARADRGSLLRDAPRDLDALEGNKGWSHDMYNELARLPPRRPAQQLAASIPEGTKLEISNLDRNVTDTDIKELFQAVGPLKKYGIRFDSQTGYSKGIAFVQFEYPEDAQKAFEQYNTVALDGKPMKIDFEEGTNRTLTSGIRLSKPPPVSSGRRVQLPGTFTAAAGAARIGYGSNAILPSRSAAA